MGIHLLVINSAEENANVVGLSEAAMSGMNDGLDWWLRGFQLDDDALLFNHGF